MWSQFNLNTVQISLWTLAFWRCSICLQTHSGRWGWTTEVYIDHHWLKLNLLEREGLQLWHTHTHIPYISAYFGSKIVHGGCCPSISVGHRRWCLVMEFKRKTIMLVAVGVNKISQPYSGFLPSFISAADWLNIHSVWQMAVIGFLGTFHGPTIWSIFLLPLIFGRSFKRE